MNLVAVAAAWLGGLLAAVFFGDGAFAIGIALYGGSLTLLFKRRLRLGSALVVPAAFMLAWPSYQATRPSFNPNSVAALAGLDRVVVEGTVVDDGETRFARQRLRLRPSGVGPGLEGREFTGDILVTTSTLRQYRAGDVIEIEGRIRLARSSGDFDYRTYLMRRGIEAESYFPRIETLRRDELPSARAALLGVRRAAAAGLHDTLAPLDASLAEGILLGAGRALPPGLAEDLRATNLTHLVVVSGSNVALIAGTAMALVAWAAGRRRALVVGLGVAWAYCLLVGPSPPVLRAAIMVTLGLAATGLGRPGSGLTALAVAALAMTAADPQVIHDVSFQLSFAATFGLIVLAEPMIDLVLREEQRHGLRAMAVETLAVTLAATVTTLPIQVHHFDRLSLLGLPANLLVAPLFPLMLASAATVATLAAAAPALAQHLEPVLGLPFTWLALVARSLSALPGSSLRADGGGWLFVLAPAGAFGVARAAGRYGHAVTARLPGWCPAVTVPHLRPVLLVVLAGAAVGLWAMVLWPRPEHVVVAALDVGDGQAMVVRDASGRIALVDGGRDPARLVEELSALGVGSRIDLLVVTSTRSDRLGGLVDLVERYDVGHAILPPGRAATATERAVRRSLGYAGVATEIARPGLTAVLDGVVLEVAAVTPGTGNRRGGAAILVRAGTSFLVPGDVPSSRLAGLAADGVVVVAPGGQLDALLLDAVSTRALVVTGREPVVENALAGRDTLAAWSTEADGRLRFIERGGQLLLSAGR